MQILKKIKFLYYVNRFMCIIKICIENYCLKFKIPNILASKFSKKAVYYNRALYWSFYTQLENLYCSFESYLTLMQLMLCCFFLLLGLFLSASTSMPRSYPLLTTRSAIPSDPCNTRELKTLSWPSQRWY